jgi:predicted secreted protein
MPSLRILSAAAALACLPLLPAHAQMQALPAPSNVISLSASASVEVLNDWLSITLSTSRDGTDANQVQSQLKQALEAALVEARKAAKPGQLEVQTGAFQLYPRYAPPNPKATGAAAAGGIAGWQGSAELTIQGRDTQAITQLAGRIQTLTIARVGFSLSREARERVEADVTAQAIARFRARADAITKAFGMGSYSIREVAVGSDESMPQQPRLRMQAAAMSAGQEALPVEAGKAVVTSNVSGSVQIAK